MQLEEEVQSLQGLNQQQQGEISALQQEIAILCARTHFPHVIHCCSPCAAFDSRGVCISNAQSARSGGADLSIAWPHAATANRQLGLQMGEVQEQLRSYEIFTELLIQVCGVPYDPLHLSLYMRMHPWHRQLPGARMNLPGPRRSCGG